jgi:hypothetical protein
MFPIKKKLRVSFDIDLDWLDSLPTEPDSDLEAKRQHLLDNPLLANKLYGLIALQYLEVYFSGMNGIERSPDYGGYDLIFAGHYGYMDNDDIFQELIYSVKDFEEEAIYKLYSMDTFDIKVNQINLVDRQTKKELDLGPIPDPMFLERGRDYIIGRGKNELMAVVSSNLANEDISTIKTDCRTVVEKAKKYTLHLGIGLTRVALFITTTKEDNQAIEDKLMTFLKEDFPQVKPSIYFYRVDRFVSLGDLFPGIKLD